MAFRGKVHSYTYSGAGTLTLPGGQYFRILSASSVVKCTFYGETGLLGEFENVDGGFYLNEKAVGEEYPVKFNKVDVYSAVAQTVVIVISTTPIGYDQITGTINTQSAKSTTLDSVADVSCTGSATTQLAAADTDRRELMVCNPASNAATHRIGDSGAGATNGIELAPGASIVLSTSAAVYSYNPGSTESLAILAVKD